MRHALLSLLTFCLATAGLAAHDWPSARGPEGTGVSREKNLPDTFDPQKGTNILWRQPYGGITTPIVMKGKVYIINRTGTPLEKGGQGVEQQERVMCFDAKTGDKVWERRFNVWLTDIVASRLGWGEVCGDPETGNVYAHGTQGLLVCLNGQTGETVWERSLTEDFGRVTGYGGRVTSPVVWEDLVILSMANGSWGEHTIGQTRFCAFDKRTGKVVWWGQGGYRVSNTYSSSPVVAVIGGQSLVVGGGGDGCVHAFKARTGEKVWSYKFGDGAINCSPVVEGDRVFIGHADENANGTQGKIICVDGAKVKDGKPELVWEKDGIRVWFSSLLLHDGRLYVHNDRGRVFCIDAKSGEDVWNVSAGRNTKGTPVWADGKLFQTEVDGGFHIFKLTGERPGRSRPIRFRPKGGARIVDVDGSVAVANGRIYFMTTEELICVGNKDHGGQADPIPEGPKEKKAGAGAAPAHLQVVPADVTLTPGESAEFSVRAFDARGGLIGEVKAEWSLAGVLPPVFPIGFPAPPAGGAPAAPPPPLKGELSAANGTGTKLAVSKSVPGQFGRVVAKMGELTAHARVRVAPVAPYEMDFSAVPEGRVPGGWVNAQGKFSVGTAGGRKVLKKRNDNPNALLAQSYTFIGPPGARDYTIEADVFSSKKGLNLSDVGILNSRYALVLEGNAQTLRILSWEVDPPTGRINKTIDWEWKPDTWYTMKLRVSVADGKATLQGKVWPRGESEPEKWTVEEEDPLPNTEGAAGLYGYSKGINAVGELGTEVHYGRVKVTPNK